MVGTVWIHHSVVALWIVVFIFRLEEHGLTQAAHNTAFVEVGLQSVPNSSVERTKNAKSGTVFQAVTAEMATPLSEMPASEVRTPGYCQIWGDPHYVTFDDKKYNFQGDCDYTLVRDCQNSSDYHLWSNNERLRPSDSVSYLREVVLDLSDRRYALIKGFHVRVNGRDVSENLPYMDEQVWIYRDVTSMNLVTDFLWVSYDGMDSADVYLSYFAGRTCGLCGSFDGDQNNDMILPSGELARSATEFGNSWVAYPDQCDGVDPGPTDPCEDGVNSLSASNDLCYYLKDPSGPFESCLEIVDPDDYYDSCVYDVCLTGDDALCSSLAQYARACRSKGGKPGRWRLLVEECPLNCPSNTVYDPCFSGCPATCSSAASTLSCNTTCQETCRCADGLVLDGGHCVDPSQCGCTLDSGVYIRLEEHGLTQAAHNTAFVEVGLQSVPNSSVERTKNAKSGTVFQAVTAEMATPLSEMPASEVRTPGYCQIWGDPHYVTFDDKKYNFQGDCDYTLVRDCQNSSDYHLWSNNERLRPSDSVSYLREVVLDLSDRRYALIKGFHVRVNGRDVSENLPYMDEQVWIYRDVTSMARSATEFGNSWVAYPDQCDGVDPGPTDPCEDGVNSLSASNDLCYYLKDPSGPFESCLEIVDPDDYYDSCVYDVCLTGDDALCSSLAQYARACRSKGGKPGRWRLLVEECLAVQQPVPLLRAHCPAIPLARKRVDVQMVLYWMVGTVWIHHSVVALWIVVFIFRLEEHGLTQAAHNTAFVEVGLQSVPNSSVERNEECEIRNGFPSCYCRDGYTSLGDACFRAPGYCQIWGDPHYVTFDDKKYNFQGDCDYTLVRDCQNSSDYHLWSNNERLRPSDSVSYLREVVLDLSDRRYALIKGFHVRVNGRDVSENLPYMDEQVWIYRDVTSMNLVTDFLWVSYDGMDSADVYLSYFAGRTCGLCGSFDGDQNNDMILPSGELVRYSLHLV
ncbi:zonadhesin-like [Strongylocentrotus purpuratus]|uniref:VWFD domain-containing protein n=1 Tax=Strongylocentrotus purpuratus TaxID=7668 RepID=A0A7M7T1L2_STRPU|nr:zonadhesin-like [Strongylocentrotus purpuratus]